MGRNRFVAEMQFDKAEPKHQLCLREGLVTLQQKGPNNFLVRYGKQIHEQLTYGEAAFEFGACLMHQGACDGLLDNRLRRES